MGSPCLGDCLMTDSMSRTSRLRLMLVLLVSLVGCDQASKQYAVTHWKGQPRQIYFRDVFRIEYAENRGAFLGLFGNLPPTARHVILVIGNGVGMAVLVGYLLSVSQMSRWNYLAWALVFAGGIGNLIDRIRINAVIDFLNLGIGPVRTGIFNVADMAITAGFLMLLPQLLRSPPTDHDAPAPAVPPLTTEPGTPA